MGRKSAKGKEKKQRKKEESAKLAAKQAVVDAANAQEDPLAGLQPFKKFDRNGYEMSEWGWSDKDKREEMTDDKAWYLIAKDIDNGNQPVAMVHFRYDLDNDDEVLYCYEIQLSSSVRRKGLGKFLMQILELLAFKAQMKKVMVTVFKHNTDAQEFFVKKLKYSVDETSPEECAEDAIFEDAEATTTYQILSKPIVVRQSAAKGHAANGGAHQFAAPVGCCGNHCHRH